MVIDKPLFIHAWWRSGSTYVWSKLRENDSCRCYFEPLNPSIADLTRAGVESPPDIDDIENFRHPILQRHYFAEYAELLDCADPIYSPDLAYDRYFLRPAQSDERLRTYLTELISSASKVKRRPVLCFCRSQLRSAWMLETLGGLHVAQIRNPVDQWASFKSYQSEVRPNFAVDMMIVALKLRHSHPGAFVHIEDFERFAQQLSKRASLPADTIAHYFIPQFVRERDRFDVFLLIWIASALQAIAHCHFALDIDQLSTSPTYRTTAEQWFSSIGCRVDFSDCCSPKIAKPTIFEQTVDKAVSAIHSNAASLVVTKPNAVKKWLPSLSPLCTRILELASA
jgi:hypothetical protein